MRMTFRANMFAVSGMAPRVRGLQVIWRYYRIGPGWSFRDGAPCEGTASRMSSQGSSI